jgi:hypothetical protein
MMWRSLAGSVAVAALATGIFYIAQARDAGAQPDASAPTVDVAQAGLYLPDPNRQYPTRVLWGDQHIHTGWSMDAGVAGAILGPEEAVRFARGEMVKSNTGQDAKLDRPLDWVAVTDHSDGMGAIQEMRAANPEFMADPRIKKWHEMMGQGPEQAMAATVELVRAQANRNMPKPFMDEKWVASAWQKNVDIMERYNEPGKFTAFISYEWTSNALTGENLHRNVIFRDNGDKTRSLTPLTTWASGDPATLWPWLANYEATTGGRVLAIPHNGNLSNGRMFEEQQYDGNPLTREWAEARARWEVLFELFQFKGQSESHPSLSPNDEFAKNFDLWDTANLAGKAKQPGMYRTEYWREALKSGMRLQSSFGTNPFKLGAAAGTDTHTGLSAADENNFWGKLRSSEPGPDRWDHLFQKEERHVRKDWELTAAGHMGVWATANTREAIWDAMKRRETYATTGPRMTLRFFGGYGFTAADANADHVVPRGYAKGVPMGGDLRAARAGQVPTFLIAAMKDPIGANLDRVQVVKGWVDSNGQTHERIYNVVWSDPARRKLAGGVLPPVGDTVDLTTATYKNSIGAAQLIGRFRDPDFDPRQRAFYYVRVLEIPTPRWTAYDAVKYKVKMAPEVRMKHQERAISSPIWYNPGTPRQGGQRG